SAQSCSSPGTSRSGRRSPPSTSSASSRRATAAAPPRSRCCCWRSRWACCSRSAPSAAGGRGTMTRYVLRFGALGYLAFLLLVPVGLVFYRAFEHGFGHAWDAVSTHEAVHALELTLLIAAIAVPANTLFGIVLA